MRTYTVRCAKDESGHWIAEVVEVPGCHTFARSIWGAQKRIREALSAWVDDLDEAELVFDVALPKTVMRAVEKGTRARDRQRKVLEETQEAMWSAVRVLEEAGFSRRDSADLLGLSHQRIQQIIQFERDFPREAKTEHA